jgi:predicted dehydrogenase
MYMVSQSRRWEPKHDRIARAIAAGKLGKVSIANCDFYLNPRFGGFRAEMPSPLILDMSIHHFYLVRMLTGADPVAVYAREFNPPGSWAKGGDVAASCIFEMSDGLVFSYNGSWAADGCVTSWQGDWRFIGEKGTMLYHRDADSVGEVISSMSGRKAKLRPLSVPKSPLKHTYMHGALREMLAFLRKGKTPQTECHDNVKSLAMVFAAMESSRKGQRVPVRGM